MNSSCCAPADFERTEQRLPFHGVAHGAFQMVAGEVAFNQVVLHPLMNRLDRQRFIVLPRQDYDGHIWRLLQYGAKSRSAVAVGKIQVQQHDRGRLLGHRR